MDSLLDKLTSLLDQFGGVALRYAAPVVVVVVLLWIVWRMFRRRRPASILLTPDLQLDVESLGEFGPPLGLPFLEFYNLPMRLAAVVLAPVGRTGELPAEDELLPLIGAVVPGLDKIASLHSPLIRCWPSQVSARGFAHAFFNHARLPGDGGKGTAWSSMAGMFKLKGQPVMAGLIFCAAEPNNLGQTIIDAEYQWLGCLRVRWS